jgi:hypothetical protein
MEGQGDIRDQRQGGAWEVAILRVAVRKMLHRGFVAELVEEEGYYRYVEDQEQNLPFGGVAMDFVEFDG